MRLLLGRLHMTWYLDAWMGDGCPRVWFVLLSQGLVAAFSLSSWREWRHQLRRRMCWIQSLLLVFVVVVVCWHGRLEPNVNMVCRVTLLEPMPGSASVWPHRCTKRGAGSPGRPHASRWYYGTM